MADLCDLREPGGKLKGLLELPEAWVPPFFSISAELHRRYLAVAPAPKSLHDLLDSSEAAQLEQKLQEFGLPLEHNSLIVRSNAEREGLEQRGLLKSFRCDGTLDGVLASALKIFEAATDAPRGNPIGLIVQLYRSTSSSGFLSNQRRVVEEARRWICEMTPAMDSSAETLPKVFPLRVERYAPASTAELRCETARKLRARLRAVGRYLRQKNEAPFGVGLGRGTALGGPE